MVAPLLAVGICVAALSATPVGAASVFDPDTSAPARSTAGPPVRMAQALTPGIGLGINWEWEGARYESMTAFIEALQAERYTPLLFKRISADLRQGKVSAMVLILERLHLGRWRRNMPPDAASLGAAQLLEITSEDTRAAIAVANKSTDLKIPDFMVEAVVGLAQRIVHKIYRLPGESPGRTEDVPVPEDAAPDQLPEPKNRAENTGLYHDVVEFVVQPHLQFLLRGDELTLKAKLLAQVLRVAQSDNLIVDEKSVLAFADRLVEAGVVEPEEQSRLVQKTTLAFEMKTTDISDGEQQSPPRDKAAIPDVAAPADDPPTTPEPGPVPEAAPVQETEPAGQDGPAPDSVTAPEAVDAPDDTRQAEDSAVESPDIETEDAPNTEAAPAPVIQPHLPPLVPNRPVTAKPVVEPLVHTADRTAKSDLLWMVETGMGITVSVRKGDLDPVGQHIGFDPGPAARFSLGALWLDALGPAHLGLSLVGVVGRTDADRLSGAAAFNANGSHSYIGAMPFLSVEMPVTHGVNIRFGGGIGVAYHSLEVLSGTTKLIDADGVSMMAQIGGGLRFALSDCMDLGFDVFGTYLDRIKGNGIAAAPLTLDGAWDVAAYASIRIALGEPAQNTGCQVFAP